jgi:hypothetical protein
MVAGHKVALGRIHAHTTVTIYVAERTLTIEDSSRSTTPANNIPVDQPAVVIEQIRQLLH